MQNDRWRWRVGLSVALTAAGMNLGCGYFSAPSQAQRTLVSVFPSDPPQTPPDLSSPNLSGTAAGNPQLAQLAGTWSGTVNYQIGNTQQFNTPMTLTFDSSGRLTEVNGQALVNACLGITLLVDSSGFGLGLAPAGNTDLRATGATATLQGSAGSYELTTQEFTPSPSGYRLAVNGTGPLLFSHYSSEQFSVSGNTLQIAVENGQIGAIPVPNSATGTLTRQ